MSSLSPSLVPSAQPVTVDEANQLLGLRNDTNEDLIVSLIASATSEAEHYMGRALMPQKWVLFEDCFSSSINLQMPPVTAIDSIKYVDTTGTLLTLSASVYQLVNSSQYTARVVPAYGQTYPTTRAQPDAVQILFSCGYASAALVPTPIKDWIKQRVVTLFENRGEVYEGKVQKVDFALSLLDRYKAWLF